MCTLKLNLTCVFVTCFGVVALQLRQSCAAKTKRNNESNRNLHCRLPIARQIMFLQFFGGWSVQGGCRTWEVLWLFGTYHGDAFCGPPSAGWELVNWKIWNVSTSGCRNCFVCGELKLQAAAFPRLFLCSFPASLRINCGAQARTVLDWNTT